MVTEMMALTCVWAMTRMTLQYFLMERMSFSICFLPASSAHFLDALVKAFFLERYLINYIQGGIEGSPYIPNGGLHHWADLLIFSIQLVNFPVGHSVARKDSHKWTTYFTAVCSMRGSPLMGTHVGDELHTEEYGSMKRLALISIEYWEEGRISQEDGESLVFVDNEAITLK